MCLDHILIDDCTLLVEMTTDSLRSNTRILVSATTISGLSPWVTHTAMMSLNWPLSPPLPAPPTFLAIFLVRPNCHKTHCEGKWPLCRLPTDVTGLGPDSRSPPLTHRSFQTKQSEKVFAIIRLRFVTVPDELPTLVKHEDPHPVVHHNELAAGGHRHGDGLHHLLVAERPDLVNIISCIFVK